MTDPKHQHTVPRFYLEGFTDKNGYIWVYDFENESMNPQTPWNTAVRTKFYTGSDKDGKPTLLIEELLSKIEDQAKPIIDKLTNRKKLTDEDYAIFSYFLAYTIVRVPIWKTKTEAMFVEETKRVLELMYGTLEAAEKTVKKQENTTEQKSKMDAKTLYEFYKSGDWEIKPSKNFTLGTMADIGRSLAQPIYNLEWRVMHAAKEGHFITSDNPLSILSPFDFDKNGRPQGGLLEPQVYKLFPLNKTTCLHLGDKQSFSTLHESISRKIMRYVNSGILWNCDRFIYSHDPDLIRFLLKRSQIVKFRKKIELQKKSRVPKSA